MKNEGTEDAGVDELLAGATSQMRVAYENARPQITPSELSAQAMSAGEVSPRLRALPERSERVIAFPRRMRVLGLVSVAAAAALVLTVVNHQRTIAANLVQPVAPEAAPDLAVEVPQGRSAIIMQTSDPKVSVVWIY